ncbi:hypothetical protein HDV00_004402 [Rhizophlyctis rosea]|nr:hypothetical protein HDV00_004402 [Rhizophlyctis rosea]
MEFDQDEATRGAQEVDRMAAQLDNLYVVLKDMQQVHPQSDWPALLEQFTSIRTRYESILKELRAPLLKALLVQPRTVANVNAYQMQEMLRTKLIPEIEQAEAVMREKASTLHGDLNLNPLDQMAMRRALESQETLLRSYDTRAVDALDIARGLRAEFEPTLRESRSDRSSVTDREARIEKENDEKLIEAVMWMASGPGSLRERERRKQMQQAGGLARFSL